MSISKRSNHRFLTKLNHRLFIKESYKQALDYKHYKDQLNVDHEGNFTFQFRLIRSITVFKELGYENIYNAYFSGIENIIKRNKLIKIKAFNLLWKSIDYVLDTHEKSIDNSYDVIDRYSQLNDLRNQYV